MKSYARTRHAHGQVSYPSRWLYGSKVIDTWDGRPAPPGLYFKLESQNGPITVRQARRGTLRQWLGK